MIKQKIIFYEHALNEDTGHVHKNKNVYSVPQN
jgi:DNA-binding winged helix-turn-helix (wHTH) protein